MRYYKTIDNGYITAIGTGGGGVEVTEAEYNRIMAVIQTKQERTETTDYRLKTDLTWEAYTVEPPVDDEEISDEEALDILLGGAEREATEGD